MEFLEEILLQEKPSILIRNNSDKIFELIPELRTCKDFAQNNIWHMMCMNISCMLLMVYQVFLNLE